VFQFESATQEIDIRKSKTAWESRQKKMAASFGKARIAGFEAV
jgi:hypothetical protein